MGVNEEKGRRRWIKRRKGTEFLKLEFRKGKEFSRLDFPKHAVSVTQSEEPARVPGQRIFKRDGNI